MRPLDFLVRRVLPRPPRLPVVAALMAMGLCPPAAAAQEAPRLTLAEAVRSAVATHPSVARARAGNAAAQAGLEEADAAWWPGLYGEGSLVGFQEPMLVAPLHTFNPEELQRDPPVFEDVLVRSRLSLDFLVFDGGGRGARIDGAEAALHASDWSRVSAEAALIQRTVAAYLTVRATRAVETAHLRRMDALEAERDRVARALQEGAAAPVEDLRARAALSEARADLESARAEAGMAVRELERLMGTPPGSVAAVELSSVTSREHGSDPGQPPPANPVLLAAQQDVESARAAYRAARSEWFPRLAAMAGLNQFGSTEGHFSTEWDVGVALKYPIFSGGARSSRVDRAQAQLRQREESLREVQLEVDAAVDRAEAVWMEAVAREEALRDAVAQLEEVARVEALALDEGVGIQRDLLDAEASLLRARAGLIQAENAVVAARVALARARGSLTVEWLDANLESRP
jgi:outer membrane protein